MIIAKIVLSALVLVLGQSKEAQITVPASDDFEIEDFCFLCEDCVTAFCTAGKEDKCRLCQVCNKVVRLEAEMRTIQRLVFDLYNQQNLLMPLDSYTVVSWEKRPPKPVVLTCVELEAKTAVAQYMSKHNQPGADLQATLVCNELLPEEAENYAGKILKICGYE